MAMKDEKLECKILKVFDEKKTKRGPLRLQVVQWGKYPPVLEKREYWFDVNDEEKTGKSKGMKTEDVEIILKNAEEIKNLLGVTPETSEKAPEKT